MDENEATKLFSGFRKYMDEEEFVREQLRKVVKELDQVSKDIITILQMVHKSGGLSKSSEICQKAREKYVSVRELYCKIQEIIPAAEFYRYNDHWRFVSQQLVFSAAIIIYLENGSIIDSDTAADFLGLSANPEETFHLELDDYLLGILSMVDELTRLSMNCAVCTDYKHPVQIAEFISDMNSGFRLLNLKNDTLRKKFDSLKYNLKKVEEVVYDLSIRGLIKRDALENVN